MYVRLAFAVAAHLEPEILIVDEVLAVGDAAFQKKCLGKMRSVSQSEGRTVVFVSHNMAAVQRLCSRSIFLQQGRVVTIGPTAEVLARYNADDLPDGTWDYVLRCPGLEILSADVLINGQPSRTVSNGATVTFRVRYRCTDPALFPRGFEFTFIVYGDGQKLVNFWSEAGHSTPFPIQPEGEIECTVPDWPFRSMPMTLQVAFNRQRTTVLIIDSAVRFASEDSDRFGTGIVPHSTEGILLLPHRWQARPLAVTTPLLS